MPEAVKTQQAPSPAAWLTLNSDGRAHPVLNALTVFTFVAGLVAFVCSLIVSAHMVATAVGIVGFCVGLGTQLNSATREQRVLIVTGIIAAFVGMALGIGHGGFS
jgi:dienelactone hydrolase